MPHPLSRVSQLGLKIIVTALCGSLVKSGPYIYGQHFWDPFELLLHIQRILCIHLPRVRENPSPVSAFSPQMALCIVLITISTGMDMAALWLRQINVR
jgi:NCS1 family nucleobase:cation symporter-1